MLEIHDNNIITWEIPMQEIGNQIYFDKSQNYYISYQPKVNETAIVVYIEGEEDTDYHVLNGDFREAYESLYHEGLKTCMKFYNSKKDKYGSEWSTPKNKWKGCYD